MAGSFEGRVFNRQEDGISLPKNKIIDGLGSSMIHGSKPENRAVVEAVRENEGEEVLTWQEVDELVDEFYSFGGITAPPGFISRHGVETAEGENLFIVPILITVSIKSCIGNLGNMAA